MTSDILPTVQEKRRGPKRPAGAPPGAGPLPLAVLVAAAVLLLTAAAAHAAGKTHKTHPRDWLDLGEKPSVYNLALSPDGKTSVVAALMQGAGGNPSVWDMQAKKQLATLKGDGWQPVGPFAFTADGSKLLGVGGRLVDRFRYRPLVGVWDAKTFTLSRTVDLEFDADIAGAEFTPDGKSLIVGTRSRRVGVYDLQTGKRTLDLVCDEPPDAFAPPPKPPPGIVIKSPIPYIPPAPALALSADGKTLAVGTHERFLFLIDLGTGKVLQKVFAGVCVDVLAFSPDGKTLVSGGAEARRDLQVWDVATGKNIDTLRVSFAIGAAYGLAFSPDGKTLAMGGDEIDGQSVVELWDVGQFGFRDDFIGRGQGGPVNYLAFSADGKTLVTAGHNATVEFWDVPAGAPKGVRQDPLPPLPPAPPPSAFIRPIPPRP